MKVVYFGSGGVYSARILDAVASRNAVALVVLPEILGSGPRGLMKRAIIWRLSREMRRVIARNKLHAIRYQPEALLPIIRSIEPDLVCVASFPHVLPATLLALPRRGSLNVHPSLLPRHRGIDPVFWTYFDDDLDTGVTVHWMAEQVDAGDIVAQRRIGIERGLPAMELTSRLAAIGGQLLLQAIADIAAGRDTRVPQDERFATSEPAPSKKIFMSHFLTWPTERVWHFLRGAGAGWFGEATTYVVQPHDSSPGTLAASRFYCVDGWISLRPRSLRRRIIDLVRRLF